MSLYSSDEDEEELDSLLLQAYTNTIKDAHEITELRDDEGEGEAGEAGEASDGDDSEEIEILEEKQDGSPKKSGGGARRYYDEVDLSIQCYRCGKSGHTKFECVEAAKAVKCRECGELGHMKAKCPNKRCFKCLGRGHQSRDCPNGSSRACTNCGESGHTSYRCKNPAGYKPEVRTSVVYSVGRGTGKYFCFNCGHEGHTAARCDGPTMNELANYENRQRRY